MDKNVNIKFNASDGGSFEKFATKYKDLLKGMSGNNYKTNKNYVFEEMQKELDFYNQKIKKEKELYDLKVRQMKELASMSNKAFNDYSRKNISKQEFEDIENKIKNQEKNILKGTGRRSWSTYSNEAKKSIDSDKAELSSKASLMDETNNLLRQILNTSREEADIQIRQIKGNKGSTQAELMAAELAEQQRNYEKGGGKKEKNLLTSILGYDNLKSFLNNTAQYGKTQNGFDTIGATGSNMGQLLGMGLGALVGSLIGPEGTAGGGILGSQIGGEVGKLVGGTIGEIEQKAMEAVQEYSRLQFKYRAITGNLSGDIKPMASIGMGPEEFLQLQIATAKQQGTQKGAQNNAYSAALLDKGFGVDNSTSGALLDVMRSMSSTDRDLMNLVGGVWEKGQSIFKGDRTYLNEFIGKNFTTLQRELTKNQTYVSSGTTLDILSRFNSVGGQFGVQHQNSMGLINQVNSALVNPVSDNATALSFNALRQLNPSAGIFDLMKTRQKGIRSPGYLKSMLSMVDKIGGDEQMKKYNFASLMGMTDNLDAAEELYNNRGKFSKNFATGVLKGKLNQDGTRKLAEENTTDLDRNFAGIKEGYLKGSKEAVEAMAGAIATAISDVFSGATITMVNGNLHFNPKPKDNGTRTPVQKEREYQKVVEQSRAPGFAAADNTF